jgi:dihydrodipicolinate synthase/N-acetylneuraminate lyase
MATPRLESLRTRLRGCYITIPTMFRDPDLDVDLAAVRAHTRFLIDRGARSGNAVLLAGGAAGDFSTMTFDERVSVATAVCAEAGGSVPVAMGAQTTSTRELQALARAAQSIGVDYIQVSCPFYFNHTEADFYEFVQAAAAAAPETGIIIYNTFWTSRNVSFGMVEKLAEIPNVVGLKWATPRTDAMEFEHVCTHFAHRLSIIDNNLFFTISHLMGVRAFEVHLANYWPEWGQKLVERLDAGDYREAQRMLTAEAMPFYHLWTKIEGEYTSGDGYLDKLCMELIGLPSSRCRPPTRDVRALYREEARAMLQATGVPGVLPG